MPHHLAGTKYLIGIDFSAGSERALLHAIRLAEQSDAQLELVHVFEWDKDGADRGVSNRNAEPAAARLWQAVSTQANVCRQRLAGFCADFVADRVPAEIRVLVGDPASGVLRAAEQIGPSLIVLGAVGRRALPRSTVGTTAERVCEKSPVPVLVVPLSN
jgi:nucleotide-binding universal stress UspA family protein